jgi:hypothetical protein
MKMNDIACNFNLDLIELNSTSRIEKKWDAY